MKRPRFLISSVAFVCLVICVNILPLSLNGQTTSPVESVILLSEHSHWLAETIYDPFVYDQQDLRVQVRITVDKHLWDDDDAYNDLTEYIRFSGNHSYEWIKATTIIEPADDDTDLRYIATLDITNSADGNYLNNWGFDKEENQLHVFIQYPDPEIEKEDWISEIWNLDVHYTKPKVRLLEVEGDTDFEHPVILDDPGTLQTKIQVYRDYEGFEINSNIIALEGRIKGGNWINIWQANDDGVSEEHIAFSNILDSFEMEQVPSGRSTFQFRAKGICENCANDEYSDVHSFDVFYMEINPGELTVNDEGIPEVEYSDHFYKLAGSPPGGHFSGPGVVENTLFFNPMQEDVAVDDTNTLQYSYTLWDGMNETRVMDVSVVSTPSFAIAGEQEVCRNDTVRYDFPYASPDTPLANQDLIGGSIFSSSGEYAYVIWHGINAHPGEYANQVGRISYKNGDFHYELYVDISKTPRRTTPYLEQVSDDLLVCSDAGAAYYQWYSYDSHGFEMLIGESEVAYLHLSPEMISGFGLASGDSVWVETTNDPELAHACYAPSLPIELDFEQEQEAQASAVDAFPNPCVDQLTVRLDDPDGCIQEIEILDVFGRVRHREPWPEGQLEHTLSLQCSQMKQGIYLLRALGHNEQHHQKIFIGNR